MGETQTVGLTSDQRDILLRGLRFVRNSVMQEIREPSPEVDEDRRTQLRQIESLVTQLGGSRSAAASA